MGLSSELIAQFVKITNDSNKPVEETTVYGTVKTIQDGVTYVEFDGADGLLTPVTTAVNVEPGERVAVMLKNHTATVTGNLSSPSARILDIEDTTELANKISEFEIVLAQKVDTEDFVAEQARIDALIAKDVEITGTLEAAEADIDILQANQLTVTERIEAAEADIKNIVAGNLDVSALDAKYAKIADLEATNADVYNLESTYAAFESTTTEKLTAVDASIDDLQAKKLSASDANITYAKVADLDATNADVEDLQAEVADIDTLIFGSATGTTIQTSFANAVIAQLGNAQIKSAMIDSISADKMTAGDINTNNVRVVSEDGRLVISDETMQISDASRVRVQIGKDASGDYSINIWDANGNLMFSKGGITDSAIKNAIIRNDMVSDTANISAHKLDIDSLFEEINNSTNTIKSTRVHLDDKAQTLDVAFKELETDVDDLGETVSSQGTAIGVIQGQISSKVWKQDIDTAKGEMSTQYSTLEQEVNKFKTTVSETYATSADLDAINIGGRNLMLDSEAGYAFTGKSFNNSIHSGTKITCTVDGGKADHYCMVTDYMAPTPIELSTEFGTEITFSADVKIVGSIVKPHMTFDLRNAETHAKSFTIRAYADPMITDKWQRISGTAVITDTGSAIDRALIAMLYDSATLDSTIEYRRVKVERGNRATDWTPAQEDTDAVIDNLDERLTSASTVIEQNTEAITARATKTEVSTAKSEAVSEANANTNNLLKNYSTTEQMNAAIQVQAEGITSSVSATYATKESLNTTNGNVTSAKNAADKAQADIDGLSIGGRNYAALTNLRRYAGGNLFDPLTCWTIEGFRVTAIDQPTSGPLPGFKVGVAGEYSFVVSGLTDLASIKVYNKCFGADGSEVRGQNSVSKSPDNGTFEVQFTVPEDTAYIHIGVGSDSVSNYYVDRLKIEQGTRATDWTPAPEDMATSDDARLAQATADAAQETASHAETLIQQLSHSISMLVTDGNGTSLMTQTEDGWTFSTADIQATVASAAEDLDALNNALGNTNSTVDVLQQAVADLGELAEYVKIGTYENEPCIELGESDSEFKLRITNTRILFMEGPSVIAHFTNQSLHIKKAVIEEELQQGEFVWKARANGNLGLIWKGVNS
jgi:hypothetical protein